MRSTLTHLRDAVPLRRLSVAEALRVAEAQANRLLRLSGQTQPPVGEEIIAELPGIEIQRVTTAKAQAAVKWSHAAGSSSSTPPNPGAVNGSVSPMNSSTSSTTRS